jgi:hypothetical protein
MRMPSPSFGARSAHRPTSFAQAAYACDAEAEWRAFQAVLAEALECVIDHAIVCVVDEAEDVRALEHLRSLTRAHFAGVPMPIHMPDFLHALAILLGGFQVEPRSRGEAFGHPVSIAAERLRHVAQSAAAAAAHSAPSPDLAGDREEVAAAAVMKDRPKRRSKPRRPKAHPSAA